MFMITDLGVDDSRSDCYSYTWVYCHIGSRVSIKIAIMFMAILSWSAPIHKIMPMSDAKKQLHNCQVYGICIVDSRVDILGFDTIQIIMNMDFHHYILLLTLVSWMLPLLEVVNLQM